MGEDVTKPVLPEARGGHKRTLPDVMDFFAGREGELLASLERLRRAVVRRNASAAGNRIPGPSAVR